jgi:hypothetical protein
MTITINYTAPPTSVAQNIVQIEVADLLRRMGNLMLDAEHIRWTTEEAIDWFNDGAREIVLRRPAARAVTKLIALTPGTYQQAPQGTSQVLDVVRNIKADGKPGRAIRITDRQQMDAVDPDWHSARAGETRHYMLDERSPTAFYVYPPANEDALVEALLAEPPPAVTQVTDSIDMRIEFLGAILHWAVYRCHTKDSEYAQGSVAALHYQAFTDAIGAPAQAAQVNSATQNSA